MASYQPSMEKEKKQFDNKVELRGPPEILTGSQIWDIVKDLPPIWGKNPSKPGKKRERTDEEKAEYPQLNRYWKKKSIFFELQY